MKNVSLVGKCDDKTILLTDQGSLIYSGAICISPSKIGFTATFRELLFPKAEDIKKIVGTGLFNLALCYDGRLMAYGSNNFGQCGCEDSELDNFTLIKDLSRNQLNIAIGYRFSLLLLSDGSLMSSGDNS